MIYFNFFLNFEVQLFRFLETRVHVTYVLLAISDLGCPSNILIIQRKSKNGVLGKNKDDNDFLDMVKHRLKITLMLKVG
jgi:hypothetical protein